MLDNQSLPRLPLSLYGWGLSVQMRFFFFICSEMATKCNPWKNWNMLTYTQTHTCSQPPTHSDVNQQTVHVDTADTDIDLITCNNVLYVGWAGRNNILPLEFKNVTVACKSTFRLFHQNILLALTVTAFSVSIQVYMWEVIKGVPHIVFETLVCSWTYCLLHIRKYVLVASLYILF